MSYGVVVSLSGCTFLWVLPAPSVWLLVTSLTFVSSRIRYTCQKQPIFQSPCRNKLQKKCVKQKLSLVCCGHPHLATAAWSQILWLDNNSLTHSAKPHAMFYDVSNKCNASTLFIQIACAFLTISRHAVMKLSPHTEWAKAYTSKCIYLSHWFTWVFATQIKIPITSQPVEQNQDNVTFAMRVV